MSYNYRWEATPNPKIKFCSLNADDIMKSIRDTVGHGRLKSWALSITDPMEVLLGFHLLADDNTTMVNAANVLFGKSPCRIHPQCKIELTRFRGIDSEEPVDQLVCEDNIFLQYDAAINFCKKHLALSNSGEDNYAVPLDVIKEACTNMLIHRSWEDDDLYPGIAIYDDRMVFQNPCYMLKGITLEDFVNGRGSFLRNDIIIGVFYRRGYIWDWRCGIENIMKGCQDVGMPKPHYDFTPSSVKLVIGFK